LRKERFLPLKDRCWYRRRYGESDQVVAETLLPGKVVPFNLANKLGVTPAQLATYIKVQPGQQITKDTVLAANKGLFGLGFLKSEVKSPVDGEVENISAVTGQVLLLEPAFLCS
jgi:biotin carboxyl carrier protein